MSIDTRLAITMHTCITDSKACKKLQLFVSSTCNINAIFRKATINGWEFVLHIRAGVPIMSEVVSCTLDGMLPVKSTLKSLCRSGSLFQSKRLNKLLLSYHWKC